MSFLAGIASLPVLGLLLLASKGIRHWYRQRHLHAISGPPRASLIYGNLQQLFSLNAWDFHAMLLGVYGRVVRIWGLFGDTQLYISDPKALHHILYKEQSIFEETDVFVVANHSLFGDGLLGTRGDHHRRQRKLLNPVFSIAHMRYMLPVFYKISHQLCDILEEKVGNGASEVDVLDWMGRVALELVGQGGLGYSFQALDERVSNEYGVALKAIVPNMARLQVYRQMLPWVSTICTPKTRRWMAERSPLKSLARLVELSDIMDRTSREIMHSKKVALEKGDEAVVHQIGEGKDIMSILLKANMEASENDRLPEAELVAQMSTLTFAAMDTTSNALSRILHVLSCNQEAQDRLRAEIVDALGDAGLDLDYDTLHELPYLDAVCRETLRLHPPLLQMARTSRKDTILPLTFPVLAGGNLTSELYVPENTSIIIAIKAINTDKAIWGEDAAEWKPERWLSPLPESVTAAGIPGVYSNTLTFLGGNRSCIGFKFSQLEMKVVLSLLLSKFKFAPSKVNYEFMSSNIVTPMIDGRPSMPLSMSRLST